MNRIDIINVYYDGYERLYEFKTKSNSNIIMWAHGIEHSKYIESGSKHYNPIKTINVVFTIECVMNIGVVNDKEKTMILQNIDNSPHVTCIGIVEELISQDSFICNIENLGEVTVELEKSNMIIHKKSKVKFTGNLEIEIV